MSHSSYKKKVRMANLTMWLAARASRNTGLLDRLCRRFLANKLTLKHEEDFMRDNIIDSDVGFSISELESFEKSEFQFTDSPNESSTGAKHD